jgi:hypothetical protein
MGVPLVILSNLGIDGRTTGDTSKFRAFTDKPLSTFLFLYMKKVFFSIISKDS